VLSRDISNFTNIIFYNPTAILSRERITTFRTYVYVCMRVRIIHV